MQILFNTFTYKRISQLIYSSSSCIKTSAWCQNSFSTNGAPKHCHLADDLNINPSVSLYSFWILSFTISLNSLAEDALSTLYFLWTVIILIELFYLAPFAKGSYQECSLIVLNVVIMINIFIIKLFLKQKVFSISFVEDLPNFAPTTYRN